MAGQYIAPDGSYQMAAPTQIGVTPGQIGLQGGTDASWASLGRDELNALIQFRNAQLAAQQQQAGQQDALARSQMGQQSGQFNQQLFFNEQAQRASELENYRNYELSAELGRGGQRLDEIQSRTAAQGAALSAASQESIARQGLGIQSFSAAEQARVAQQNQALQQAQLVASLRGPSNAFKQLEVNMGLNRAGQSNLLGALAGEWNQPAYAAPGGVPEAATLQTMARDAGSTGTGGGFSGSAGIQGLLGIGSQNARLGADGSTIAEQMRLAKSNEWGINALAPGPASWGAQLREAWTKLLAERNGVPPAPDDPAVLAYFTAITGLSEPQARAAALFAHDWAKTRGAGMDEGQLNDMIGQVREGLPINPTKWRNPGGAPTGPAQGAPPVVPGAPPPTPSIGSRILQRTQQLMAAGQWNDAAGVAMWVEMGATPAQAQQLYQTAKNYFVTNQTPISEGQLNDMWGQVSGGQAPDPTKWRQPPPVRTGAEVPGLPPPGTPPTGATPGLPAPGAPAPTGTPFTFVRDTGGGYQIVRTADGREVLYNANTGMLQDPTTRAVIGPGTPTQTQPSTAGPAIPPSTEYTAPGAPTANPTPAPPSTAPVATPGAAAAPNSSYVATGGGYTKDPTTGALFNPNTGLYSQGDDRSVTFTYDGNGFVGTNGKKYDKNWSLIG